MKKYLLYFFCVITVYLYIFAPPFRIISFGVDKVFIVISFIYITYVKEWGRMLYKFKYEFLFLLAIFSWSTFTTLVHNTSTSLIIYDFLLLIEVIPCSYALFLFLGERKRFKIDKIIIDCAVLGALVTFYLILNPHYAFLLKSEILKYPEHLVNTFIYRGYGLSDGLLFSYPVIQGFCLAFILLGFYKHKIYYFFSIFLLIAIVSNARSGFFPVFVSLFLLLLYNSKRFLKIAISVVALGLLTFSSFEIFLEKNEMLKTSFDWGMTTFDIIGDFFSGKETENFDTLLINMIIWPNSIFSWVIGSGEYLFTGFPKTTDIGYLLRLNFGGIIYLSFFVLLCIYMAKRLYDVNKQMALLLFFSLLYLNFKGDFFIVNPGSRFFLLIYVMCVLDKNVFIIKNKNSNRILLKKQNYL